MLNYIENAVTLEEIARLTNRKAAGLRTEAESLGIYIGVNWGGAPAMSDRDAFALVSGEARRTREDDAEWAEHLDACADWTRKRDEAVSTARQARTDDLQRKGRGGPEVASLAGESAQAAGRHFEMSTPPPQWHGTDDGNARRLYAADDDQPGRLARAASALMESVR